jgi:hypothetical protein
MPLRAAAVLLLAVALLGAGTARADGDLATYEVAGEAPADASDARTRALDAAFAEAVARALAAEVDAAALRAHRAQVDAQIIGRARRWVASFQTVRSETTGGRLRVVIRARIDRGKLRAALAELGIGGGGGRPKPRGRPRLLVLVRGELPGGAFASFGARGAADAGPTGAALQRALAEQGFVTVAPVSPVSSRPGAAGADLPVDDPAAVAAARAAGAGAVAVIGILLTPDGRIRATTRHGAPPSA